MDIGELLAFQPDKPDLKRRLGEDGLDYPAEGRREPKQRHVRGANEGAVGVEEAVKLSEEEREKIIQMVDEEPEAPSLDDASLRRLILTFEKKVYKNQEMRIKFPDMPEKFMESEINLNDSVQELHVRATIPHIPSIRFMESEIDLNDSVQELHVIATTPDMYHHLVELNAIKSLLQLIGHENTDISIAVIDLLQELTDVDTLTESEEGATALIDALLDEQIVATLVQNLDRLDDTVKEEAQGIHNTLGIVENMTEFRPEMCADAAKQGLMQWLLKKTKPKVAFDGNKLYGSEILAILLQDTQENREVLGELDGIDVLLQQLAVYKRHDPSSSEETEFMENLFNCLCSALMLPANKGRFLRGEGLQLMNLMLREKKQSRFSALKVLDHAMTGSEGADNCAKFIEILGLRSLFPLFMKTPKKLKGTAEKEHEEHVCSIVGNLLKNSSGQLKQRLLGKFTESDHIKLDRLMELHFTYLDRVHQCDDRIDREKQRRVRAGDIIDDDEEDEYYLQRLDAGLFTLQLIDYIILELSCASGISSIKQRVIQLLNMRGGSISAIRNTVREYAGNLGDGNNRDSADGERQRLLALVDKF